MKIKPIAGCAGYFVTDCGRVFSEKSNRWLARTVSKDGYSRVCMQVDGKTVNRQIHRLVAEAFIPDDGEKEHAAHIDGVKSNNHASNLRWSTRAENEADKATHGTKVLGMSQKSARLCDKDIPEIRKRIASGETNRAIASDYGVSDVAISKIRRGKTWTHIDE